MGEAAAPQAGDVLAGKYRVERVLGEGGMGVVVEATHTDLDQRVALKFMHESVVAVGLDRFMREAKAVAMLKSEHVARVMDVGRLEDGAPYIVMEFLEGEDLGDLLERRSRLPLEEAVDYVLQASIALAEAHARGVVHRDIKPRNLFLTRKADDTPLVKVLDFGISKITNTKNLDDASTRTGMVLGSPKYMSPEQSRSSKTVDARTDIWSLGVVLYELYTGQPPFTAQTLPDMFVAILPSDFEPASKLVPGSPAGLDAVFDRCLAKEPGDRYATMAELASALSVFASPSGVQAAETVHRLLTGRTPSLTRLSPVAPRPTDGAGIASNTTLPISISTVSVGAQQPKRKMLWYAAAALAVGSAISVTVAMSSQGSKAAPS
ncbi:MAG TPA: serine/threonine-protein kinase, partial [Polyangiaceae bacterium]|nr:serine/threonine-protein kinase [Polyangiaceae bacterium]